MAAASLGIAGSFAGPRPGRRGPAARGLTGTTCIWRKIRAVSVIGYGSSPFGPNHLS